MMEVKCGITQEEYSPKIGNIFPTAWEISPVIVVAELTSARCIIVLEHKRATWLAKEKPMVVKWIRMLYLIIAWLFPVAILFQVFLVGLSLFTSQPSWDAHVSLGHMIGVLPILLVILGYLGRFARRTIILTWLALGTYIVQAEVFATIRADAPLFAAFHPVLALVLFALSIIIALRAQKEVRARVQMSSTSQQSPSMEQQEVSS